MRDHLAICSYLSGNCLNWEFNLISFFLPHSGCGFAAGGEYFRSHIAAGFGPFIVLLGQDGGELLHPAGRDPSRYDVAITEASARSARRRCSRNAGKYDPCRSFGIASSTVPVRGHLPVPRLAARLDLSVPGRWPVPIIGTGRSIFRRESGNSYRAYGAGGRGAG
jgi:hypothetical protein